jgi:MFS family permease
MISTAQDRSARRNLNLYWWGQATSAFGSVFTGIAMPVVAVVRLGATPGQIGLISAASVLPVLLLGLPAGAYADRIARPRRTLILLDAFSAIAVGAVALGLAGHVATVGWLIALGVAQGCVTIVTEIVYFIHLREVTGPTGIGPARARLQAGQFGASLVGRLLVGPTIVAFGGAAALSVDAVSYVMSAAALLTMGPAAAPVAREAAASLTDTLRGIGEGLRFFTDDAFHRALAVFIIAPVIAATGASALTAPFLLRVAHVPTGAYGLIFAASGLLGLAGSTIAGRLLHRGRDARLVTLASFTASLTCALLLPMAFGAWPVAAVFATLGIGLPVLFGAIANVALGPLIVADVAETAVGRTIATLQVGAAAAGLIGALGGGVLGGWIGVRSGIWVVDAFGLVSLALSLPPALRAARHARAAVADGPVDDLVEAV